MTSTAVSDARERIDARGELPREARRQLRRWLTEHSGARAWAELEAAAARHERHRWESRFPDDAGPWAVLDAALGALRAGTTLREADRRMARCWDLLIDVHEGPDFRPTYAGFAALAAARVATGAPETADGGSERDIEVEDWDACFLASLAACGGAVWEEDSASDDALRRDFWEWYLDTAETIGRKEGSTG